jgi:hypothetical protein
MNCIDCKHRCSTPYGSDDRHLVDSDATIYYECSAVFHGNDYKYDDDGEPTSKLQQPGHGALAIDAEYYAACLVVELSFGCVKWVKIDP